MIVRANWIVAITDGERIVQQMFHYKRDALAYIARMEELGWELVNLDPGH